MFRLPLLWILLLLVSQISLSSVAFARDPDSALVVKPFIEMHTGPGLGYPIFYIAERDTWITITTRKSDWFKIRTDNGKEGWVSLEQLRLTQQPDGTATNFQAATIDEFTDRQWELGATGGDFGSYQIITLHLSYAFTPHLAAKLSTSKLFSTFASGIMADTSLVIHPFPDTRLSPFFALGTGIIKRNPFTTLTQEQDQTDQIAHVEIGARIYLIRHFVFHMQYSNYVIYQSQTPGRPDSNQEIDEWKAGFAVFF